MTPEMRARVEERVNEGLKNQWYPVAKSVEIRSDRPYGAVALGRRMVLWRDGSVISQMGAPDMRVPIAIYMVVIALMCVAAIGAYGAGAPWMVPVGAVMFTASDIAVVRDRFVSTGFINRAWGLPLYFGAQLLLASTVATPPGAVQG